MLIPVGAMRALLFNILASSYWRWFIKSLNLPLRILGFGLRKKT
jgi:hypothetical protein